MSRAVLAALRSPAAVLSRIAGRPFGERALAAADNARQIIEEAQKRTNANFAALRGPAPGIRREGQDQRQALDVRAAWLARAEQGSASVHGARRGQRHRAAGDQSSGSRVGSVDVDAGDRARPSHRAAGPLDEIFRHGLQLRGPGRARRRSVRLPARGRRCRRGALCWKIQSTPREAKSSQYTRSLVGCAKRTTPSRGSRISSKTRRCAGSTISRSSNVQGIWTARVLEMSDLRRGSRTRLTLDKLQYNVPMKDEDFTLQAIRRQ